MCSDRHLGQLHLTFGSALFVELFVFEADFRKCTSYLEAPCGPESTVLLGRLAVFISKIEYLNATDSMATVTTPLNPTLLLLV